MVRFSIHSLALALGFALSVLASTERGPNTYIKVTYGVDEDILSDKKVIYYDFGECYPFQLDDGRGYTAERAKWYQSTDCQSYENFDCTGEKRLNLPIPAGTYLVNAADFAQLLTGNAALCIKSELL